MNSIVSDGEHSISTCTPSLFAKINLSRTESLSVGALLTVSIFVVILKQLGKMFLFVFSSNDARG